MSKSFKIFLFGILFFCLSTVESFAQCAMCRTTIESTVSNGRSNIATGINTGILYLLAAPYLIVVVVGFLWWRGSSYNK
jgi:CHASE3 domain sensor protein